MKTFNIKRFFITTVTIVLILLMMPLIQFGLKSNGFKESSGIFSIVGTYKEKDAGNKQLSRISIRSDIGDFSFDSSDFSYETDEKKVIRPAPVSWKTLKTGVVVEFETGMTVTFTGSNDPSWNMRISISSIPAALVRLPMHISGTIGKVPSKKDTFSINSSFGEIQFKLAPGITLEKENRLVVFTRQNSNFSSLVFSDIKKQASSAIMAFQNQTLADPAVFRSGINAWIAKAWDGWDAKRYNSEGGTWSFGDNDNRFSEKTLVAYLAESFIRNKYLETREKIQNAVDLHEDKMGWLSSVYYGGLIEKTRLLDNETQVAVREITQKLEAKDISLFEREKFIQFVIDRAPYSLAKQIFAFASDTDFSNISVSNAIGLLGCVVESYSFFSNDETNPFRKFESVAERRILPAIQKTQEGFFLVTDGDKCDIYSSFLAGVLLMEYGKKSERDVFTGIGQSLVNGIFGLADGRGFTPKTLQIQGGTIAQNSGLLAPEILYPLIADNSYYPHAISFARDTAPGLWAWTCADNFSLVPSPDNMVFNVNFPLGMSHYTVVHGVKPFEKMQLYGIDFRTDPQYETYNSSGWAYKEDSQTLFIKFKHKNTQEKAVLSF